MPARKNRRKAKGTMDPRGIRAKISIAFDEPIFDRINRLAAHHNTSFAQQVRALVEWGFWASEGTTARPVRSEP